MGVHHHKDLDDHNEEMKKRNKKSNISDGVDYTYNSTITSPGLGTTGYGLPFTSNQWRELERQAMIYKYLKDSIPIPPQLLVPVSTTLVPRDNGSVFDLNFKLRNNNGKDSEPGRCKRTDGKKWRCSRDVAPHQKYCERHLHRGRPRSRKPVEIIHNNNNNNINNNENPRPYHQILPSNTSVSLIETPLCIFGPDASLSQNEFSRGLDWAMQKQWHQFSGENITTSIAEESPMNANPSIFQQDVIQDSIDLFPFSDFEKDRSSFFFHPDLENNLINAWSSEDPNSNESSVFSQEDLSLHLPLSLSLASSRREELNYEWEMSLNSENSGFENQQISTLISNEPLLDSYTLGGPLAEVLQGRNIGMEIQQ